MSFLPPNQQRQSTEGKTQLIHKKTAMMDLLAVGPESALPACHKPMQAMPTIMYRVVGFL